MVAPSVRGTRNARNQVQHISLQLVDVVAAARDLWLSRDLLNFTWRLMYYINSIKCWVFHHFQRIFKHQSLLLWTGTNLILVVFAGQPHETNYFVSYFVLLAASPPQHATQVFSS